MKTLSQAIADRGINEAHEVSLLRRRARHALLRDRTKVYASTPLGGIPWSRRSVHEQNADLMILKLAGYEGQDLVSTAQYVAAWCRLNHLMEC